MQPSEFNIFQNLIREVHQKAFGEPLSPTPYGKAQALSIFIEEMTGQVISYKTLSNYICAALWQAHECVNPNATTLGILVRYLYEQPAGNEAVIWYQYRSHAMRQEGAAAPQLSSWKTVVPAAGGYALGVGHRS
ncbi:MAG: hypothetical protein ACKVU2_08115 [Saprospiraceae bacterium]